MKVTIGRYSVKSDDYVRKLTPEEISLPRSWDSCGYERHIHIITRWERFWTYTEVPTQCKVGRSFVLLRRPCAEIYPAFTFIGVTRSCVPHNPTQPAISYVHDVPSTPARLCGVNVINVSYLLFLLYLGRTGMLRVHRTVHVKSGTMCPGLVLWENSLGIRVISYRMYTYQWSLISFSLKGFIQITK